MVDRINKEHRSWNMSRIKGRDTGPERMVRSMLHRMGYRFRLNRKDLIGKPDIVLPKYNTVIFVHGCFWHRHHGCKFAYTPKSNKEFWNKKFELNVKRDHRVKKKLEEQGWHVIIIWECEIRSLEILSDRIAVEFKLIGSDIKMC
jgi:DNA mismatch endonuclease (patch repair protein)